MSSQDSQDVVDTQDVAADVADPIVVVSPAVSTGVDLEEVVRRLVKYLLEGLAVAIAAFYIPKRKMNPMEISVLAVTAAATFAILDFASPSIAKSARGGAGFGIGLGLV